VRKEFALLLPIDTLPRAFLRSIALLTLLSSACPYPATAQTKYSVTDIGTLPNGNATNANGINAAGEVVGFSYIATSNANTPYPVLFDGAIHQLGTAVGSAWAINNASQVVGVSADRAFLYDGTMHDLGLLPGHIHARALGINDSGIVVGESYNPSNIQTAFLYDGAMRDLGYLPGDTLSLANGINNDGMIVGGSGNFTSGFHTGHAFVYDGSFHYLGTLTGLNSSEATAINNLGKIAGFSWAGGAPSPAEYRAWLYDGTMHDLGAPGRQSLALAINDSGILVGGFYDLGEWHAFAYRNGEVHNLNDYLDASGAGWSLSQATAINASGQIAGWGFHRGRLTGFLLSPVNDNIPPLISGMPPVGCSLWPPNGKLVQVATVRAVDPESGLAVGSFRIAGSSNEESGANDILITPDGFGAFVIKLRADRLGKGAGRVYTLTATATDLAQNSSTVTTTCTVPHNKHR